jgi:hypothetical protein
MMRLGRKPQETPLRNLYLHRGDDPDAAGDQGMLIGQITPPDLAAEIALRWNTVDAPAPPVGEGLWPVGLEDGQLTTNPRQPEYVVGQFLGVRLAREVCRRWALAAPDTDEEADAGGVTSADTAKLRAILRSNMLDGHEAGVVTMSGVDLLDEVCDLVRHEWAPAMRGRWVAAELRTCAGSVQQGDLYDERRPVADFLYARAAELERGTDE